MIKKLILLGVAALSMNAATVQDVRLNGMTPIVLCSPDGICDGKNAINVRIDFGDTQAAVVPCNTLEDCGGVSVIEIRKNNLKPVVGCTSNGNCGDLDLSDANFNGVMAVVPCDAEGNCQGTSPSDIRINNMTPVVICKSNGEC